MIKPGEKLSPEEGYIGALRREPEAIVAAVNAEGLTLMTLTMAGVVVTTSPEGAEVAHQLQLQAMPRAQPLTPYHPPPGEITPVGEAGAKTETKTELQATMAEAGTSSKTPICLILKGPF